MPRRLIKPKNNEKLTEQINIDQGENLQMNVEFLVLNTR